MVDWSDKVMPMLTGEHPGETATVGFSATWYCSVPNVKFVEPWANCHCEEHSDEAISASGRPEQ